MPHAKLSGLKDPNHVYLINDGSVPGEHGDGVVEGPVLPAVRVLRRDPPYVHLEVVGTLQKECTFFSFFLKADKEVFCQH